MNDAQREPRDEQFDEFDEAEGFEIPVQDAERGLPATPQDGTDWTRTQSVRDDPESLGAEARKLWDAVYSQFLQPLVRNYPEAAEHLTSREWEILELLAQGRSTAEIASGLVITTSAVRAHITAVVRKLRVPDRAAAIELFGRRLDT